MSRRCARWSRIALRATIAAAAIVGGAEMACAGVREQAVLAVLKYAREIGVGVGAGVAGNYVYEKLHGSKAEASPAPRIDDARMRELIRGMIADQKRLDTSVGSPIGISSAPRRRSTFCARAMKIPPARRVSIARSRSRDRARRAGRCSSMPGGIEAFDPKELHTGCANFALTRQTSSSDAK